MSTQPMKRVYIAFASSIDPCKQLVALQEPSFAQVALQLRTCIHPTSPIALKHARDST